MSTGGADDLRDAENECERPRMSRRAPRHGDIERKHLRCAKIMRALDLGELIRDDSNPACAM